VEIPEIGKARSNVNAFCSRLVFVHSCLNFNLEKQNPRTSGTVSGFRLEENFKYLIG
jgi:hypothetical protein